MSSIAVARGLTYLGLDVHRDTHLSGGPPPETGRLCFTDDDFVGQGSDRLVDALVAWGDVETVGKRVKEHLDAGADHVCIQVFDVEPRSLPSRQWRTLATAML